MNLEEWKLSINKKETRRAYTNWLRRFCEYNRCRPGDTLRWPLDEVEDRMERFKNHLVRSGRQGKGKNKDENGGLAGNGVKQAWSGLKRWFYDNHVYVRTKCRGLEMRKTYYDHIPTREQLDILLDRADLQYKTAFALVAFSGMRPVDVENLRFKGIERSLERDSDAITIFVEQQKTGLPYVTFLGPQGLAYLRALLEKRKANGERITGESPVVTMADGRPMTRKAMRDAFLRIARRTVSTNPTGEYFRKFRLYSLRKYFRSNLRIDESEKEYLMGHVEGLRGLAGRYSGLADMDPKAIEDLRQKYIKALPHLETKLSEVSVRSQVDVLSAKVALLEEMVLKNGLLSDRKDLREMYLDEIGTGGGKSAKVEWDVGEILKRLEHLEGLLGSE